mgnify:CR=1 FL=1
MQINIKIYSLLVFGILVVSCQSDEMESNTISMEDFSGGTGPEDLIVEKAIEDTLGFEIQVEQVNNFVNDQKGSYTISTQDEFMLLDRFNPEKKEKLRFESKIVATDSILNRYDLFYYAFEDTVKTKNALYNWFDCFGDGCQMIKMNENIEDLQTKGLQTLVFEKEIVILVNNSISSAEWTKLGGDLKKNWIENPNLTFTVSSSKKLIW